jgi:hypothetical protein
MAVANQYQMSMDSVLRQFGTMASEMAVLGASGRTGGGAGVSPLQSFSSTAEMTRGISNALPADWVNGGGLVTTDVRVTHWATNGTTISGNPNLMTTPAIWRTLETGNLRSSLLPPRQPFIGRSWGYRAQVSVSVADNMSGIQTSWQRNTNTGDESYITNATGVLYSNRVSSFMTITEIPTQFSVQGQNLSLTNRSHRARIGGDASRASTVLGRTVDLSEGVADDSLLGNTKVVARGGIARRAGRSWDDMVFRDTNRVRAAQAEAGSGAMTDLEEAGSAVLVNVGTRGREIFRAPGDYLPILAGTGRMPGATNSAAAAVDEFLKYWLPYYQCNFRVTITLNQPNLVRHAGDTPLTAAVSAVGFVMPTNIAVPVRRGDVMAFTNFTGAPRGFGDLPNTVIQPEAKTSLHRLAGNGGERPINVVMRAISTRSRTGGAGTTAPTWVNTVDIDLDSLVRLLEGMPRPGAIPSGVWTNLPVALHVDIRGPNGAMIDRAERVPVVVRKGRTLRRAVSIVTPGTLYIQGKFGSEASPGRLRPHAFSLFAPKIKFGMEGRQPNTVAIKGQRVGVGGGTNRQTDILSVASGETGTGGADVEVAAGRADVHLSNVTMANTAGIPLDQVLPPVFLKDWLIETYSNF